MRLLLIFLGRYARPYLPWLALGVGALILTNAIAVWIPREIQAAVDVLGAALQAPTPPSSAPAALVTAVGHLVALALALILIRTLSRVLFFNPGRAIERDLRDDIFARYLVDAEDRLAALEAAADDPEVADDATATGPAKGTGDLIARATHDVLAVRALVGFGFLQATNMTLLVIMVVSQMLDISARVTLFAAVPMAVGLVVLRWAIRRLMTLYRAVQEDLADLEQQVLEGLKGIRVVRDFGAAPVIEAAFARRNERLLEMRVAIARIASFQLPIVRVVGNVAIGILLIWAGWLTGDERLTVGEIAAYIAYLSMLVGVLFSAGWMLNAIQRGLISLQRIDQVMPLSEPRPTRQVARPAEADAGPAGLRVRQLAVERSGERVLDGVDLDAAPGGHLGILGTVGSGKSTLVAALTGFEAPASGGVILETATGPVDDPLALRRRVRAVPDVPFLFTRSLRENVGLVDPPSAIDDARVAASLRVAAFDPAAEGLADGIETLVGEKGVTLSGGQKQRITLARALYAEGDVLVLDDVLSAVDHRTEHTILERLAGWRRARGAATTLVNISNRVSALQDADEIVVLHEGRVVERGTPQALEAADGLYARTHALQEAVDAAKERPVLAGSGELS